MAAAKIRDAGGACRKRQYEGYAAALTPLREVRYLKDTFENLMAKPTYAMFPMDENGCLQDFYYLTLTDENDIPNAMQPLQSGV